MTNTTKNNFHTTEDIPTSYYTSHATCGIMQSQLHFGCIGPSLLEVHTRYDIDWENILPNRRGRAVANMNRDQAGTDTYEVSTELLTRLEEVLHTKCGWIWESMSCHLDCFLMVELSFFCALATETKLLTDDVVLQSPALVKLFKVLLAVGTKNQDTYKMAYWAMEIEEY